jgi:competence protein ComEC
LVDFLKKYGIKQLDAIFITHQHQDHMNSLPALRSELPIKEFFSNQNQRSNYTINSLNIQNLSFPFRKEAILLSENNRSLILLFSFFKYTFLITGDAEIPILQIITPVLQTGTIDVLQVPHHGSQTSFYSPFLKKLDPKIGIVSGRPAYNRSFPNKI